jgi:hypothetical protein
LKKGNRKNKRKTKTEKRKQENKKQKIRNKKEKKNRKRRLPAPNWAGPYRARVVRRAVRADLVDV